MIDDLPRFPSSIYLKKDLINNISVNVLNILILLSHLGSDVHIHKSRRFRSIQHKENMLLYAKLDHYHNISFCMCC